MKFLFVTDLDNTFVGNDEATATIIHKFSLMRDHIYVVYATGRSIASARDLQAEKNLLEPDYWVTGVGSEIYRHQQQDQVWADRLSVGWDHAGIVQLLGAYSDLIPQPAPDQNPWKQSYYLRSGASPSVLTELVPQLATLGAKVIFSSGQDVDILPLSGDKGMAMTYLREHLEMPQDKTVVCGDSGNDISLFQHGTLGIIVGNARSELLEWHQQYGTSQHYIASAPCAWGILEGMQHFNLW